MVKGGAEESGSAAGRVVRGTSVREEASSESKRRGSGVQ